VTLSVEVSISVEYFPGNRTSLHDIRDRYLLLLQDVARGLAEVVVVKPAKLSAVGVAEACKACGPNQD